MNKKGEKVEKICNIDKQISSINMQEDLIYYTVEENMDSYKIKKEYGDRLVLHGGINAANWNNADVIIGEIEEKVPVLKQNGGFIFSSDHSIPNDVSLENMKRIMEAAKRAGTY